VQLPPTEEVLPGLWSIAVPFPDNPLGYTLVDLFETDRGAVLIDAGWDDDVSWEALVAGFIATGTEVADCYGVLVTHVHPDHHGLSGRVREASSAWVAMHELDVAMVTRMSSTAMEEAESTPRWSADFRDELAAVLLDAGATEEELAAAPRSNRRRARPRPLVAPDRLMGDGEMMDVPGWAVEAVWTPGHTPGHTCFRVPAHGVLLAGDHVLPSITPHISISRTDRKGDPLGDFLDSLRKVDQPDVRWVLPAHRHRFEGLHDRVVAISDHHYVHLADIEAILSNGPVTLWQIAARLTWNRPWEDYPLALRRAAVNETAAHLRYLTRRNRATRLKGVRPFTFALPEGTSHGADAD
jgi:glyoxylase-like metal-dependent hydrolase (beta-lactamase superfamily II)